MADVELYTFTRGTDVWRLTPHEFDVVLDGQTWLSAQVGRSALAYGAEPEKSRLELNLPPDSPVPLSAINPVTSGESIQLTVQAATLLDGQASLGGVVWMGRITGVEFAAGLPTLRGESVMVSLKRVGLRRLYGRKCSLILYQTPCNATPISASGVVYEVWGRLVGIEGGIPPAVAGTLAGGWLETAGGERHMIDAEVDVNHLTLLYPAALAVGDAVTLVAGCDHTTAVCDARFGNLDNYGGQPGIPQQNPFSTGIY